MDRAKFFARARSALFGGKLTQGQVDGITAILHGWQASQMTDLRWLAYMLATAYHETARTMQPIAEYGKGKGRKYGVKGKHGQVPYGRGYVQLTWDANYEKADQELGFLVRFSIILISRSILIWPQKSCSSAWRKAGLPGKSWATILMVRRPTG